jgi:hypothetical protein
MRSFCNFIYIDLPADFSIRLWRHDNSDLTFIPPTKDSVFSGALDFDIVGPFDPVLKLSWISDRYEHNEVEMLKKCGGMFGVAQHFMSFPVRFAEGIPADNHLFLPHEAEQFVPRSHPKRDSPPVKQHRRLWCRVTNFSGVSLVEARDARNG